MENLTSISEEQRSGCQEGILEGWMSGGMKVWRFKEERRTECQEGKPFNNSSSIDEISQQPLTETNHSTVQPFYHSTDNGYTSKKAFTLAEVLITLAVIGVIAAMTLPSVVKHYQQQATVNQLKKAYSEFSQALHKAEVDNGLMETWNFADFGSQTDMGAYFGENYLFPYIKTVEKCVPSSNKCWADKITNVSGNILGESDKLSNAQQYVSFVTASGYSGYYWLNKNGRGMWYWVDINGPQKGPNKIGRDIFAFETWWNNGSIGGKFSSSAITGNLTRDEIITQGCSRQNAKNWNDGKYCGALIMHDGWKIGDGYPW